MLLLQQCLKREQHRPTFTLDMTQAEWAFKESQWVAYIGLSAVSDQVKVQQLKAACEESLLCRVYDAGGLDSLNLLSQSKKLAQHSTFDLLTSPATS